MKTSKFVKNEDLDLSGRPATADADRNKHSSVENWSKNSVKTSLELEKWTTKKTSKTLVTVPAHDAQDVQDVVRLRRRPGVCLCCRSKTLSPLESVSSCWSSFVKVTVTFLNITLRGKSLKPASESSEENYSSLRSPTGEPLENYENLIITSENFDNKPSVNTVLCKTREEKLRRTCWWSWWSYRYSRNLENVTKLKPLDGRNAGLTLTCQKSPNFCTKPWSPTSLRREFLNKRHRTQLTKSLQVRSGNVERNPGPNTHVRDGSGVARGNQVSPDVQITSYNVRGLKDEGKMRHLFNQFHRGASSSRSDFFFLLQETYINKLGKIPYLWRGNYFLTNGEGHSGGCLTLLSHHLNIVASKEIAKRAHVLVCQRSDDNMATYIVANIYAPNANTREKLNFYEQLFEYIGELELTYDCSNIIIGGDFNLAFKPEERRGMICSAQEKNMAKFVTEKAKEYGLSDIWENKVDFTWRRPNTSLFSCIDHVLYNKSRLSVVSLKTNWALSYSDHASIEIGLSRVNVEPSISSKIPRLDPSLVKTPESKLELEKCFDEMWKHVDPAWDPHVRLEYAKMCIRTVGEKLQADRKKKEKSEEEEVNEELNLAIGRLEKGCRTERDTNALLDYVEELRARKEILIEVKGERLAEKLGSKWYNEGEKSTRYFMRLLNRKSPDKFGELINAQNVVIKETSEVESEIVNFYKNLYETYDKSNLVTNNDDSFFDNVTPITDAESTEVVRPVSVEDLAKTLQTCRDSAPGPDGIPYSYIGALWSTMGPLICEAWNHSLTTGKLCPSHQTSHLRLIPKAGKDPRKLTNWRPITLSNCDHKIVTKTYASRMCEKVSKVIRARQTAYLKGRLINDNIRAILNSVHLANLDDEMIDGLLVSLDAKKAFDSVEHSFIESCLAKFGLTNFIPIFKTLYKDLRSNILINGKVVDGYMIKRGVKQGDALSCIIFIMCMEPLIANIEANQAIEQIHSINLDAELPKAYTYADDLNCVIKKTRRGLQAIFDEYSRLTKLAGLELNADKTKIIRFASELKHNRADFRPATFNVDYLGKNYEIKTVNETKINGIFIQQDEERMRTRNVEHVKQKMDAQLKKWSRRGLTTLGKILIVKTFGVSQAIFLMQSITLGKTHVKQLNDILFKFIWNKNFQAPKAPERVKREYVNLSLRNGGYGMLNISELDDSLKLRAVGRLMETTHPALTLLRNKIDLSDFFYPKFDEKLDSFVSRGIELLKTVRQKLWEVDSLATDTKYVKAIRGIKIRNMLKPQFRNSLEVFMLNRSGITEVSQLSQANFDRLKNLMGNRQLAAKINHAISLRLPGLEQSDKTMHRLGNRWVQLQKLTAKELRQSLNEENPLLVYKCGLILDPGEGLLWLRNLNSVKSTGHKNAILRFIHGDIYSQERLFRFNMSDSPNCETCGELETINHKIVECNFAAGLWQALANLVGLTVNEIDANFAAGAHEGCSKTLMTIHGELISILIRKLRLTHLTPDVYLRSIITRLINKETGVVKAELVNLLR